MTTTTHTPGPWYRNIRAGGKYPTVFAGDAPRHVHIAHVQQIRGNPDETEANIDLIAAAPELLAACKALLAGIRTFPGVDSHVMVPNSGPGGFELREIDTLIAKAEGRA